MLPIFRKLKIISKAFAYAGFIAFIFYFLPHRQFSQPLIALKEINDLFFYRIFFKNRLTHLKPSDNVVIIDSLDPQETRSRSEYAELIRKLGEAHAAVIGVDVLFSDYSKSDAPADSALVDAVQQTPRTVLAMRFGFNESRQYSSRLAREEMRRFALTGPLQKRFYLTPRANQVELPFDSLLAATKQIGCINTVSERYHALPLVFEYQSDLYPAFPFEVARIYRKPGDDTLDIAEIPLTYATQVLVNIIPKEHFNEPWAFADAKALLDQGRFESFRNKIVLLVNSGSAVLEISSFWSEAYPTWAVQASLIEQFVQNRNIKTSRNITALLVVIALLLALIWHLFFSVRLAAQGRRVGWLILIGDAAFFLIAFIGLQFEIWVGVITPMLIYTVSLLAVRYDLYKIYNVPDYEDFSIAVSASQNGLYPVTIIHSPVGEETEGLAFPKFFEEAAFTALAEKLRQGPGGLNEMRELGGRLYNAIFQRSLETRFVQSLNLVKRDQKRLRIRLRLEAPEVSRLPWEYMFGDKLTSGFVVLHKNISLVRYVTSAATSAWPEYRGPLLILVVIASPSNLPLLDVAAEKRQLQKSLRTLIGLRQVKIAFCDGATLEKLHQKIAMRKYDVLHFIGHGDFDEAKGEGRLIFEDDGGGPCPVEAEAFGHILNDSSIRLAILNSCESAMASSSNKLFGVAQKLVKVGVPAVVAMQHKIQDDIAIMFAQTFYTSFLANFSIDAAVADARRAIMTRVGLGRKEWGTPVLFMRADGAKAFEIKQAKVIV